MLTRKHEWWDRWFLGLAQYVSTASKDSSTKCGAVLVDLRRRVVSTGYNGFPIGISDDWRIDDRSKKYELVCHAESNAIDFARRDLTNCAIYIWPCQPCPRCATRIIQNGIKRVVAPYNDPCSEIGLRHQFRLALELFQEAGVAVTLMGEETTNAVEAGFVQESDQREHQHGDARGETTEAGRSYRDEESRQVEISFQQEYQKAQEAVDKYKCGSCGRLMCECGVDW